ncbi:RagB/SusD domain-containing protein [Leeuwenhoekiella aestuarii]|uniref:RagB/SusD family nutrient uptake outer membrane protein n=1 Tax=Leeuwenhoekiella aestuarii TaxID=2249426 RepID=UPI000FFEEA52|nr:RagB/SusD family nutrient uptake outer membrane protein [Leeuwenhoekiella aestuarii]RXG12905.1 RagB/SusD domain-containing protein [Leeuwenhoekiella aestuarii]
MKHFRNNHLHLLCIAVFFLTCACEPFVEVDVPNDRITSVTVFSDDATAREAMDGVYIQLFNTAFAAGGNQSVSFLGGLSGETYTVTNAAPEMEAVAGHQLEATNSLNLALWSGAYNTIYMCNAILEGVADNSNLSRDTRAALEGESRFIRAFTYFYLNNLYGDVPLITQTDYTGNALKTRSPQTEVYDLILEDLNRAAELLDTGYPDNERTRANRFTALGLLARVHLYLENWEQAESYSSEVLAATDLYELPDDLNTVFLANSPEALWQVSQEGWGGTFTHTRDGNLLIRITPTGSPVSLSETFMQDWESGDLRQENWIGSFSSAAETYYYPYKYKIRYDASAGALTEYSMIMRLAEQYLIRAEARTRQGKPEAAVADLNAIRERAGLEALVYTPALTQEQLLEELMQQRDRELFSEWGHRWLDLKRTGQALEVLDGIQETDLLYPIPEDELLKNPNLTQNAGY